MPRLRIVLALAFAAGLAACNAKNSPVEPTPATPAPVTPPVVTLPSCSSWAATQKGTNVPPATGSVVAQRAALLAAGGGLKTVGTKYYAAVFPSNFGSSRRQVLIGLHGTGGAPETDWSTDWQTELTTRGWGYLGLKYVDDGSGSYDDPPTMYANIKTMVDDVKASCDLGSTTFYLVGFSRGSAESFSLSYLDRHDRKLFAATGHNSGAWPDGTPMPPTLVGFASRNETNAYAGARFWMYCGEKDFAHGYSMCTEMANAKAFVEQYGGKVDQLYRDPNGTHGGLNKNSDAMAQLFSFFNGL